MRTQHVLRHLSTILPVAVTIAAQAQSPDWSPIQSALHANGTVLPGPVLHYDLVRRDLSIVVAGTPVNSATVGNGYVNFKPLSDGTYFTDGSVPAQESEVPALEAALRQKANISIAAVVNHAAEETPKLLWVHFESTGNGPQLATEIASALATVKDPQEGVTAIPVSVSDLPSQYRSMFTSLKGTIAQLDGAVYEVTVARPDESNYKIGYVPASPALGVGITFYIQPTSGSNAIVNSEFALKIQEIPPVLDALRKAGFKVPALHDHFVDDHNRLYYVHGFTTGDINTIGATLDKTLTSIYNSVQ